MRDHDHFRCKSKKGRRRKGRKRRIKAELSSSLVQLTSSSSSSRLVFSPQKNRGCFERRQKKFLGEENSQLAKTQLWWRPSFSSSTTLDNLHLLFSFSVTSHLHGELNKCWLLAYQNSPFPFSDSKAAVCPISITIIGH